MSTLKLEHIAHIDNAGPDISIDSNGNVGIGTTSPSSKLHVSGTAAAADNSSSIIFSLGATVESYVGVANAGGNIISGSAQGDTVFRNNGGNILFSTDSGSNAQVYIKSDGNVGIGTTDPKSTLDVYATTGSWTRNSVRDATSAAFTGVYRQSGTVSAGVFAHNSALNAWENLWINAHNDGSGGVGGGTSKNVIIGGNVGIGTTAPTEKLHIKSGGNAYKMLILESESGDAGILLQGQSGNQFGIQQNGSQRGLFFYDRTAGQYRILIDPNGNVGIGTTNPTSKLHTDGAMVSTNLAQGTGELQIQGYGSTGYINMNGSGSLIFRMGSSYSQDLKLTSAGILQGSSDAEIKTSPIRKHSNTISTNTTIDSSENAIASGPISVATGVTLTINGNMTVV